MNGCGYKYVRDASVCVALSHARAMLALDSLMVWGALMTLWPLVCCNNNYDL